MIGIDVALPRGTILAEPLTDECLWRQGRGSLVELSTFDGELLNQKVSSGLPACFSSNVDTYNWILRLVDMFFADYCRSAILR